MWRLHSTPQGCYWAAACLLHTGRKAQLKHRQKAVLMGPSLLVPYTHFSLTSISLCLVSRAITQPLLSSFYCFCITDKETEPWSKDHTSQADLNLRDMNAKALLLPQEAWLSVAHVRLSVCWHPAHILKAGQSRDMCYWTTLFLELNHTLGCIRMENRCFISNFHRNISLLVHSEFRIQRTKYSLFSFENIEHWK